MGTFPTRGVRVCAARAPPYPPVKQSTHHQRPHDGPNPKGGVCRRLFALSHWHGLLPPFLFIVRVDDVVVRVLFFLPGEVVRVVVCQHDRHHPCVTGFSKGITRTRTVVESRPCDARPYRRSS